MIPNLEWNQFYSVFMQIRLAEGIDRETFLIQGLIPTREIHQVCPKQQAVSATCRNNRLQGVYQLKYCSRRRLSPSSARCAIANMKLNTPQRQFCRGFRYLPLGLEVRILEFPSTLYFQCLLILKINGVERES